MTTVDTSHLVALQTRLSHERARLNNAKTPREIASRTVTVQGIEREIAGEYKFLGMTPPDELPAMSDDDLLAELGL
jgi:hypothetical protein